LDGTKFLRYMPVITGFERLNFRAVAMMYHRSMDIPLDDDITMSLFSVVSIDLKSCLDTAQLESSLWHLQVRFMMPFPISSSSSAKT